MGFQWALGTVQTLTPPETAPRCDCVCACVCLRWTGPAFGPKTAGIPVTLPDTWLLSNGWRIVLCWDSVNDLFLKYI